MLHNLIKMNMKYQHTEMYVIRLLSSYYIMFPSYFQSLKILNNNFYCIPYIYGMVLNAMYFLSEPLACFLIGVQFLYSKSRSERRGQFWGCGRDGLGVWDQQMQTIIYRMDKQQGPTA